MMNTQHRQGKPRLSEERFIDSFFRTIKTITIHQDNNQLIRACLKDFVQTLSDVSLDDSLSIQTLDGSFYINGERLRRRQESVYLLTYMMDFFRRRNLAGLRFDPKLKGAPTKAIVCFVRLLIQSERRDQPSVWLARQIPAQGICWVEIIQETGSKSQQDILDHKKMAWATYFSALASVKDVAQKISNQGHAGVRTAKRIVQKMVDLVIEDETLFLALSTIKDYDDYTYTHSVNVLVLSMCIGKRIGLTRRSLVELGICGLFHDLGKVEVSLEILNKPGKLSEHEWKEMRNHPLGAVKQILKLHASYDLKTKILLAPFEHHLGYDLSGYPRPYFMKKVSLFGRILQIADVYDAITSQRIYRPTAYSPDQALSFMLEKAGKEFDPILLKVFSKMMGRYPVGTLVQLDSGETGLVVDYLQRSGGLRPRVLLLQENESDGLGHGDLVDLSEKNPENGLYRRNILKTFHPADYEIQPAYFLLDLGAKQITYS